MLFLLRTSMYKHVWLLSFREAASERIGQIFARLPKLRLKSPSQSSCDPFYWHRCIDERTAENPTTIAKVRFHVSNQAFWLNPPPPLFGASPFFLSPPKDKKKPRISTRTDGL